MKIQKKQQEETNNFIYAGQCKRNTHRNRVEKKRTKKKDRKQGQLFTYTHLLSPFGIPFVLPMNRKNF